MEPGHLPCALHRRAGGRHAAPAQAVDVLDDNDRVIDKHTDAQRQAGQGLRILNVMPVKYIHHDGKQHAQRHT